MHIDIILGLIAISWILTFFLALSLIFGFKKTFKMFF